MCAKNSSNRDPSFGVGPAVIGEGGFVDGGRTGEIPTDIGSMNVGIVRLRRW